MSNRVGKRPTTPTSPLEGEVAADALRRAAVEGSASQLHQQRDFKTNASGSDKSRSLHSGIDLQPVVALPLVERQVAVVDLQRQQAQGGGAEAAAVRADV